MMKTLLMSMLVLGFALLTLTGNYTSNCLAANESQPTQSSFAGRWSGEWYATATPLALFSDGLSEHNGTWDISIDSDGEVTGTDFDKTAGHKSGFKGFIDEDGNFTIFYNNSTTTVKGVLEKKGSYLTGSLKVTCKGDSKKVCGTIEIRLKRGSISSNPSKSQGTTVKPPVSDTNNQQKALPNRRSEITECGLIVQLGQEILLSNTLTLVIGRVEDGKVRITIRENHGNIRLNAWQIRDYKSNSAIAGAFLAKAGYLEGEKNYREALDFYTMGICLDPNDADAYSGRGNVRSILQDYRGAIEDYSKCIQLNPINPNDIKDIFAYMGRGDAKLELQDYRGAIADYNQVFRIDSAREAEERAGKGGGMTIYDLGREQTLSDVYNQRGIAKDKLGDKVGACEDLRKSCSMGNSKGCEDSKKVCN